MSKVKFILYSADVKGGLPATWPEGIEAFEKETVLSHLPVIGMTVKFPTGDEQEMTAEVDAVVCYPDKDEFEIELEVQVDELNVPYLTNKENGWVQI